MYRLIPKEFPYANIRIQFISELNGTSLFVYFRSNLEKEPAYFLTYTLNFSDFSSQCDSSTFSS